MNMSSDDALEKLESKTQLLYEKSMKTPSEKLDLEILEFGEFEKKSDKLYAELLVAPPLHIDSVINRKLHSKERRGLFSWFRSLTVYIPASIAAIASIFFVTHIFDVQVDYYLSEAVTLLEQEQARAAAQIVDQGLQSFPDNIELQALRDDIEQSIARADKRGRVAVLLATAEDYYSKQELTEPASGNALATYLSVLELDKGNQTALEGLERIAEHFLQLAKDSRLVDSPLKTMALVNKGLAVWSSHPELLELRDSMQAEIEAQRITAHYANESQLFLEQRDYDASLASLEAGLELIPNSQVLLDLKKDIQTQKTSLQRDSSMASDALAQARQLYQAQALKRALGHDQPWLGICRRSSGTAGFAPNY